MKELAVMEFVFGMPGLVSFFGLERLTTKEESGNQISMKISQRNLGNGKKHD